jgi:hypothetical protein
MDAPATIPLGNEESQVENNQNVKVSAEPKKTSGEVETSSKLLESKHAPKADGKQAIQESTSKGKRKTTDQDRSEPKKSKKTNVSNNDAPESKKTTSQAGRQDPRRRISTALISKTSLKRPRTFLSQGIEGIKGIKQRCSREQEDRLEEGEGNEDLRD